MLWIGEILFWSLWKADGEETSSAGIGAWKFSRRVSLEGEKEVVGRRSLVVDSLALTLVPPVGEAGFGVALGLGYGRWPCAIV